MNPLTPTQCRQVVRDILLQVRTALDVVPGTRQPALTQLLDEAAVAVWRAHHPTRPPAGQAASWLAAEAAFRLARAKGWQPAGLTDPELPQMLARLDDLAPIVRVRLLATAADHTLPRVRASGQNPRSHMRPGPCPCPCNNAATTAPCGCGHRGCGNRRR
ncbi:hypothetical protein [Streptomyces synnematoformans]|uniref:Uncharacterized protein n=1 Tax=Streptomyces synnematoformans TaxID=415721 RepID=A0ABN2XHB9_9ACTN